MVENAYPVSVVNVTNPTARYIKAREICHLQQPYIYTMKVLSALTALGFATAALADFLPNLQGAPSHQNVKERIAPPAGAKLYDVWYAKGNRIYQCNPERTGFQHWYNVQTHAFMYPTKGVQEPFERPGQEIGQLAAMPLNGTM